jgi:hypothetical protein
MERALAAASPLITRVAITQNALCERLIFNGVALSFGTKIRVTRELIFDFGGALKELAV